MADEHDFDIDIYGDDQDPNAQQDATQADPAASQTDPVADSANGSANDAKPDGGDAQMEQDATGEAANGDKQHAHSTQQIASTGGSAGQDVHRQAPQKQGMKRKQGDDDDRPTDPGATAALMVNDVNWWISEEDIRGWANQSGCEDEVVEVTFNEHKVNGKSKGQVYVQLQTPQAATALKHQIDNLFKEQTHTKKPTAIFNPPHVNPFKTLPKDVPARDKGRNDRATPGNYGNQAAGNYGRGGFNNNRGAFNNSRGNNLGYQNRNFSGPVGGAMGGGNMANGYGAQAPMNSFNNPMGGMNNFGGFNRGGMMGNNMRGGMNNRGRGGAMGMGTMGANPMGMGMPMGGNMMAMGGNMMGMGGNMGMMGGMGGGFNGNPQGFNPGFFQGNQGGGGNDGSWQNPHGAKRPRPE